MPLPDKFRFQPLDTIGAADAEEDIRFLQECFIDAGYLTAIRDCSDPRRIIVGRTGSGKTALLAKLSEVEERVVEVRPESLALSYISNSAILNFCSEIGVKLDIFFKLLWRHVLTVELLKRHFKIDSEPAKRSFISKVSTLFRNKKHAKAYEYLEEWGKSFWEETEYRIKEVTTKLEKDLERTIGAKYLESGLSIEQAKKLSAEQKEEVLTRAQKVVNDVQIRQLSEILDLLDEALEDPQKRYFITIDGLDEDWVEERLRLRLIRALIETVRDFRKVKQAKVVISLRLDLLDRVFRLTRDAGFQEEKYESLYCTLVWDSRQLVEVIDKRIGFLVKQRYTTSIVTHRDLLPRSTGGQDTLQYIIDRTLMRIAAKLIPPPDKCINLKH